MPSETGEHVQHAGDSSTEGRKDELGTRQAPGFLGHVTQSSEHCGEAWSRHLMDEEAGTWRVLPPDHTHSTWRSCAELGLRTRIARSSFASTDPLLRSKTEYSNSDITKCAFRLPKEP